MHRARQDVARTTCLGARTKLPVLRVALNDAPPFGEITGIRVDARRRGGVGAVASVGRTAIGTESLWTSRPREMMAAGAASDDMGWSPKMCDTNIVAGGSGDSAMYGRS